MLEQDEPSRENKEETTKTKHTLLPKKKKNGRMFSFVKLVSRAVFCVDAGKQSHGTRGIW